jgi:hypothetical protein
MPTTAKKTPARPVDPSLVPSESGVEVWRNATAGLVYINRIGEYGRKFSELIQPGRAFQVTPTERRLNQNSVALAEFDVFTNGTLEPVDLIDDEPDTEKLRNNPNLITDKDVRLMFRLKGEMFRQRIEEITNVASVNRLLEAARDENFEASLAQFEVLKMRKITLDGNASREAPEPSDPNTAGLPRAVTPS